MQMTYLVHIVAGSLALVFGYVALYAPKGAALHRGAGRVFVYAMLAMSVAGTMMAAVRGVAPAMNIPAGVLTAYLVITALITVRPIAGVGRRVDAGAMLVGFAVGVTSLRFGFEAITNGGTRNGMPAFPFLMFGIVGMLGVTGDIRMLRTGALTGARRVARHLWRMCFALFIAAMSFFIGQAQVIPQPIRIYPLLALPVLAVLLTMLYWLWRVRLRRSLRGMVVRDAASARAGPTRFTADVA